MKQAELVIAISSRALFNLNESHAVYKNEGVEAYKRYQIEKEDEILEPGEAFSLVKKLLNFNALGGGEFRVEVILLSRNSADSGLRIFNSIKHYDLPIIRAVFCGGENPYPYLLPMGGHLFLSAHSEDVKGALTAGIAAAHIVSQEKINQTSELELRIAFDGDAVIFSDESHKIFEAKGEEAFSHHEILQSKNPLTGGPFKIFLSALQQLQKLGAPIRTALVTARAAPAHERVIRTLRAWDIRIDEAFFLGGLDKGDFLRSFQADIFFDDQWQNCESARSHSVPTGHVVW